MEWGGIFLLAVIGVIAIIIVGFLALVFMTRKKSPDQGIISQVATGVSEAKLLDQMPAAQPVVMVGPTPDSTAPAMPQAYDPTTGARMSSPPDVTKKQVEQEEQIMKTQERLEPVLKEVVEKMDSLEKKVDDVTHKVEENPSIK